MAAHLLHTHTHTQLFVIFCEQRVKCSLLALPLFYVLQPKLSPSILPSPLVPLLRLPSSSCAFPLSILRFSLFTFPHLSFLWKHEKEGRGTHGRQWRKGRTRSLGFVHVPACLSLVCAAPCECSWFSVCLWVCLLLFVPFCLYSSTSLWADQQALSSSMLRPRGASSQT